ncbi:hypothetical protein MHBO_003682 [Bonamia ostreae]|uniref:Translin n=1 Tax=Bonamia ostreae TaxID=126728 RepID=A0ABV2AR60_9EUKA
MSENEVIESFAKYKTEINERNDKREEIVVLSRSITKDAKRVIFHLHRIVKSPENKVISEAEKMLAKVRSNICKISDKILGEFYPKDYYLHERLYSFGLQEYIEAESFMFYLKNGALISISEIEDLLENAHENGKRLVLSTNNYILGIADLTFIILEKM